MALLLTFFAEQNPSSNVVLIKNVQLLSKANRFLGITMVWKKEEMKKISVPSPLLMPLKP